MGDEIDRSMDTVFEFEEVDEEEEEDDEEEEEEEEEDEEEEFEELEEMTSPRISCCLGADGKTYQGVMVVDDDVSYPGNKCQFDDCSICLQPMAVNGEHRLCFLPCGHLYGFSCIKKWLSQSLFRGKCPQCNFVCACKDVVLLHASTLCVCPHQKENARLAKIITDKNNTIEKNGTELQKLRIVLQKIQLQNWNLAQSNSQMTVEHNIGKQKLEELQHQLACKDALFKAMTSELQVQREMNDQNGTELQKLRIVLQTIQLQYWNLAQSNSQMTAEHNIGKQKLEELQHQLACKDALFKAMTLELQVQREMNDQKSEPKVVDDADTNQQYANRRIRATRSQSISGPMTTTQEVFDEETAYNVDTNQQETNRRIRPIRSQSIGGPMTTTQHVCDIELFENKRRKVRRQYARYISQEHETNENLLEIEDLNVNEECLTLTPECRGSQRLSLGRPSRKAAEKIRSYKETPLNIKMRRPE